MIWLVFMLVFLAGLLVLAYGRSGAGVTVDPVAHYKAQLLEIDADAARGMIDPDSATAARLEVQRRLLRATAEGGSAPVVAHRDGFSVGTRAVAALVLVAFAGGLYALMGSPSAPSAPPPQRQLAEEKLLEEGGITMGQAVAQIKAHLENNPDDLQGWQYLATTASAVGDFSTAATAFGELARANPDEPNVRIEEFEAYMAHANGQITPAARLVLAAILQAAPDHPAGQYYLGLAHLQAGNEESARAVWLALADRSTENAPWMPTLRRQLSSVGVNPPELTDEDIAVVNSMTDSEREEFLNSMLARLESQLDSDPSDTRGWMMLARSKLTMGDKTGAISALKSGISANPGDKSAELQAFLDNIETNLNP